jgi:acetyl esterase/lipase
MKQGLATAGALAVAASVLALGGAAAAQPAPDPVPPHRVEMPGAVTATYDVVYRTLPGYRPLTLDVYAAAKPGGPARPLVVYVHGGNWVGGSLRSVGTVDNGPQLFAALAARGYTVASVGYRLSGEARFPAAEQDVKSAIRWLRAHAADYGVDPARVAIWGGSAGGQLAALAATSCGVAALEPSPAGRPPAGPEPSDCVQAAVIFYPLVDLAALDKAQAKADQPDGGPDTVEARYLGCRLSACPAGLAASANPITYIDGKSPPMLIMHGTADRTSPFQQSQMLQAAMRAKGAPADLVLVPGVDHLFQAGSPEANAKVNREVMDKVFAFFDDTIGAKR